MKDIMIDLETIDTNHTAVIIQIGAVYFNKYTGETGELFLSNINPKDSTKYGSINIDTVMWWMNQSKEVQSSVFQYKNGTTLINNLNQLNSFIKKGCKIWSHSTFDIPILMHAYKQCNIVPSFSYKSTRDLRTISGLAKSLNMNIGIDSEENQMKHNALQDCLFQIKYLTKFFSGLCELGLKFSDMR